MKQKSGKISKNVLWMIAGVALLIVGFVALGQGPYSNPVSLTVAPIILVIAYLVVIPYGILTSGKKSKGPEGD